MYKFSCPCWRISFALAASVGVFSCISCAHPPRPPLTGGEKEVWRAIDAAHAQEEAAVSRKDVDGAMAECSPDYIATSPGGRTANKNQSRQAMVALFQMSDRMKETNAIQDISLKGNTATVTVKNHVELTMKSPSTGESVTKEQNNLDRETWVKDTQGWLLKGSEVLKSS